MVDLLYCPVGSFGRLFGRKGEGKQGCHELAAFPREREVEWLYLLVVARPCGPALDIQDSDPDRLVACREIGRDLLVRQEGKDSWGRSGGKVCL